MGFLTVNDCCRKGRCVATRRLMSRDAAEALRREHAALRARLGRLREALSALGAERGPLAAAVRELLPELFQHVAMGLDLPAQLESEHLSLRSLGRDLQVVLENPQLYPDSHLARLAGTLAASLSTHLDREMARLLR